MTTHDIKSHIDNIYKSESARILSVLTRIFGPHNLELAEDTLQDSFSKALTLWQEKGLPKNPVAWLITTAKNQAIDQIRANKTKTKFSHDLSSMLESEWSLGYVIEHEFRESNIKDDQLRMVFMCCQEDIKPDNRIPFILRTLCGLSIPAIARALLLTEATVKKRLLRTKNKFKSYTFEFPDVAKLAPAMDSVHTVLYLLFNEGFHCSDNKQATNELLCQEALGLINLLVDETRVVNQDTLSLFALMYFHISRIKSKVDKNGVNIPIDLQNRSLWETRTINIAKNILNAASMAKPGASGRFLIEAKIAREHCIAESFEQTNWQKIVTYYEQWLNITTSPVVGLNKAIAVGYAGNIDAAISQIEALRTHKRLKSLHMPSAILAHFYAKKGCQELAYENAEKSKALGGTLHEHRVMMNQIERLLNTQ